MRTLPGRTRTDRIEAVKIGTDRMTIHPGGVIQTHTTIIEIVGTFTIWYPGVDTVTEPIVVVIMVAGEIDAIK